MPPRMLERSALKGYKSFREIDLSLKPVNVLIGANGSGKSNFISLFKLLNRLMEESLQVHVAQSGGADQILHYGRKTTDQVEITLWFKRNDLANGYSCTLIPAEDTLLIKSESTWFHDRRRYSNPYLDRSDDRLKPESGLSRWVKDSRVSRYVYQAVRSWRLYHFHDTSESARVRLPCDIHDNQSLHPEGANLAAYLYLLRERYTDHYRTIIETVRLVAPFFGDFVLRPSPYNPEKIRLEWKERGSDTIFGPGAFSDGTLRFICLATLFLQPIANMPATIVIDEPELGLHPYAIKLLSEMIRSVAHQVQSILSTQSVTLINQFAAQEILVVDRIDGVSVIRRLDQAEIENWLDDYSLGDLWEKNVLGGRPRL